MSSRDLKVEGKQTVAELLWQECLGHTLGKRVEVSLYPILRAAIPDKQIIIQDVVDYQQADEIYDRFRQYLEEYSVYPILGTLGGNVLCVGISDQNRGTIYYFDFDFGLFELCPTFRKFMEDLNTEAR